MPATASFSILFGSLLGISGSTNLALAKVIFSGGALSAADHVDLGTNGTAIYVGKFSAGTGALSAGQVTINNVQNGVTVQVSAMRRSK